MIVDRVPVIGRVVHVGERRILVEPVAHLLPALMTLGKRRLDVHCRVLRCRVLRWRMLFSENRFPPRSAPKDARERAFDQVWGKLFRSMRYSFQLPKLTGPP